MTSDSDLPFLRRVLVLPMVTFCSYKNPSVSFKQSNDFYHFVRSHSSIGFSDAKVIKRIPFPKQKRIKVLFLILIMNSQPIKTVFCLSFFIRI